MFMYSGFSIDVLWTLSTEVPLRETLPSSFHRSKRFGKEKEKEMKLEEDGGLLNTPQSAFLGPTLWDKTLPYNADNFQLEYMDLEEFLLENNIPANPQNEASQPSQQPPAPPTPQTPTVVDLSTRDAPAVHNGVVGQNCQQNSKRPGTSSSRTLPGDILISCFSSPSRAAGAVEKGQVLTITSIVVRRFSVSMLRLVADEAERLDSFSLTCLRASPEQCVLPCDPHMHRRVLQRESERERERQSLPPSRDTPSPIDPDSIQVPMAYEPDPADLALSSVPGQAIFDPRKRKFSAEELKPQPMIKKARKVFIPEDLKDDRYWARRRKNNIAAKRSRDARRLKENQIAIRAGFLEKENAALRQEVAELRKELGRCKNVLAKYEARHGPL
ncbi:hypothetical protein DNTS_022145 [Danionella cerebrum]|uniref:BZIP domain-containing protein n=1 Tax=Danionella cerebrum TaxID=2873325 RepID=A0A553R0Q2_9TELE|nr:hypothetical protein DNTS_022145 [Danionella translucida]